MMEFFRKYQRFFVLVIAGVTLFSFLFFGTFSTFTEPVEVQDRVLTKAVDGSKLMQSEVELLARFIATDRQDPFYLRSVPSNFCNDGVIRFDLLQTGLADTIASEYFDSLLSSFEQRLEKVKRYRFYVHPDAPFLSSLAVWEQMVPEISQSISQLQKESSISLQTFRQLVRLYELQTQFPAEQLRKILLYQQQQQYTWLKPDPYLKQADFSLFGFHSTADWFGQDFIDLAAQFILNAARLAEKKGYRVSLEEAKADLIRNYNFTVQKIQEANQNQKLELNFSQHLKTLGFDERTATAVWRNVLLFRRYFQGVGEAAFIDRLPYTDFAGYALEAAVVHLYEWPSLSLKSFSDLVQFHFYIEAIAKTDDLRSFPSSICSFEEIASSYPELLQTHYVAKIAQVSKKEIGLRASLKEVWDWQIENWESLKEQFSFLASVDKREERFEILRSLSPSQKTSIDTYTRKKLVDLHPEWIENGFGSPVLKEIFLSQRTTSLRNIEKVGEFTASLELAETTQIPFRYSDDGEFYYQISEVEKKREKHLLTFDEAKKQGILAQLVLRSLEKAYPEIRTQHPKLFKSEDGQWKSLSEVKDLVAKHVYADWLKEIDRLEPQDWPLGEGPLESYPTRRLLSISQIAMQDLQKNPTDAIWLQTIGDPVFDQFKLIYKEKKIQRVEKGEWIMEEAFSMIPGQWSSVHIAPNGEVAFFYFQEKTVHQTPILEQLMLGKEMIAADAQRFLAERLVEETKKTSSIIIPIRGKSK